MMEVKSWKNHVQNSHPEVEKFVFIHGHIHTPRFEEEENISSALQAFTYLLESRFLFGDENMQILPNQNIE